MDEGSEHAIEKRLVGEVAAILRVAPERIGVDTPLPELGIDSMGFVELLVVVEKAFGLRLAEHVLEPGDFATVGAMARRIAHASTA